MLFDEEDTEIRPEFSVFEDRKLGEGGFGAVYACRYADQDATVKIFVTVTDLWDGAAYAKETKLLKILRHDNNVIKFYDVLSLSGSLAKVLQSGFLDDKT